MALPRKRRRVMAESAPGADRPMTQEPAERLQRLAEALCASRKEAIDGRASSGIEDIWREDEEHYEGIDDANRGSASDNVTKPPGQLPPNSVDKDSQSTVFPNITQPYVDAAAARVGDILLPTDAKGWSIKETPIPELIEIAKKADEPLSIEVIEGMEAEGLGEDVQQQVADEERKAGLQAQAALAEAKDKAKRAEKRIEDWHVEGQFHGEMRQLIDDAARIGTGILKGPMPVVKRQQMYRDGGLIIELQKKPVSKCISAWNCYPDPSCGSSIHNGRYHWECGFITAKQLDALKQDDSYIAAQIDACLLEGPSKVVQVRQQADGRALDDKQLFQIWYYYGFAQREDLEAAGCECPDDAPVMIPAAFTMVNDRVIKGALNHIDTGEFPYDYLPWQKRKNSPWGTGIGRKMRTAQQMVVAATRVMMTNAGRAAGPLIIMRNPSVRGANGSNNIEPWKVFYASKDDDVRAAFAVIEIPDRQQSLAAIMQIGLKLAEDTTGMPLLLQGQAGSAPETYGGQQLVDRNATGVLRRIARTFDDCVTEPHIRRYYTFLLLYGPEDDEKGEFVIDAKGSTALVEREVERQFAQSLLQASLNPVFKLDPAKTIREVIRAENRNPKDFELSEEDQKKLEQTPPPKPPQVRVAEIREEGETKRFAAKLQVESAEKQKDRELEIIVQTVAERIWGMRLAGQKELTFEQLKAELAKTVINARVKSRDAARQHAGPNAAPPPTEPAGRAPVGQAFTR